MSRNRRAFPASTPPPTRRGGGRATWPNEPVSIATGTARVEPDPDRPRAATLYVNDAPSSYVDLDDPGFLAFEYMQNMAAVIDMLPPGPVRAVHLGAAGCSLARYVEHARPGSRQIGVDLDARLLELAREWFDLPRSPALRLRTGEARAELAGLGPRRADVVIRDVFAGTTTPEHLTTVEFTEQVARSLAPTGVYLANIVDRPPLATARREVASLAEAWGPAGWDHLALIAEPAVLRCRRFGNIVLVAARPQALAPADTALARRLRTLPVPARLVTGDALAAFAGTAAPLRDTALGEPSAADPGETEL